MLSVLAAGVLVWSSLTSDEEVTSHDEHQANGGQHEAGTVSVVLVAHKTDAAHRVPIHLQQEGVGGVNSVTGPSAKSTPLGTPAPYQFLYLGHSEDSHSEDKRE